MSENVGSVIFGSGMVENVGIAVEIHFWPLFELLMSADVAQCWQCRIHVGRGKKYWGSLQNRVAISSRLKFMLARLFGIRHLDIRMSHDMSRDQFYGFVGLL